MNDASIINGLLTNNQHRAIYERELYQQFQYFIKEGCKKYNLSYDDSFSAYSDALLSAIVSITNKSFNQNSSLKTYIFQIFLNKCVDQVRKNATNKQSANQSWSEPELLSHLPDHVKSVIEKLIDGESIAAVKQSFEIIGDKCKEILLLFEGGYSDKEIAEKLTYSNPAVAKTTRLRCREKLKNIYNNRG